VSGVYFDPTSMQLEKNLTLSWLHFVLGRSSGLCAPQRKKSGSKYESDTRQEQALICGPA
jgi:hypothetical protein